MIELIRTFKTRLSAKRKKKIKRQHVKKKGIVRPCSVDVDKMNPDTQIHISTHFKSTHVMVIPSTIHHRQDAPSSCAGQVLF